MPSSKLKPPTKWPSTTPWEKVAMIEPAAKTLRQMCSLPGERWRNSKATPRRMRPISMAKSGR